MTYTKKFMHHQDFASRNPSKSLEEVTNTQGDRNLHKFR